MGLKQCPFWVIACLLPDYKYTSTPRQSQDLSDAIGEDFCVFLCKRDRCQMWDEKRKDCGLKQPSPSQEQNKIPKNWDSAERCPVTIPEKDWDEQMNSKPDFHPVDCPAQFPSEPE